MHTSATTGATVRYVTSGRPGSADEPAVELAVTEYGGAEATVHLVLVHGFPDDQTLWQPVIAHLPDDWHVVTYDVRGAGRSGRPSNVNAYRMRLLAQDFLAVVEETIPANASFHLAAHDWGSIACWDVLALETIEPRLRGRISSYTSASGPCLDHLGDLAATREGRRALRGQVLHSWYVWFFQLPLAPEFTWRRLQRPLRPIVTSIDGSMDAISWGAALADNARQSVHLYRANVLPRLFHPHAWVSQVPTRLLVALRDGYVTPASLEGIEARVPRLTRVQVDAGHWWVREQPERYADEVVQAVASASS